MDSFIGIIALVVLIYFVVRLHSRVGQLEFEVGRLRALPAPGAAATAEAAEATVDEVANAPAVAEPAGSIAATTPGAPLAQEAVEADADFQGPWAPPAPADQAPSSPEAAAPKQDIESALGSRWAVWVGGLALAFGAVFLIRYSIESGIFGPKVRLTMAALFGVLLVAAGEFIRRTGFKVPVQGLAGAYVPGILTAAGSFALFGSIYAAHGLYGFIGPATAFVLLGIVALGTLAAALVHGQALAGLGLLGSLVTPVLVASESPNPWVLFGYLAIVLAANTAVARLRVWVFLATAGMVGTGLWCLIYMYESATVELPVVMFIDVVMLATLAFIWLGRPWAGLDAVFARHLDLPSAATGLFVAVSATAMMADPVLANAWGDVFGALLIAAMVAVALHRPAGVPLLFGAGIATIVVYTGHALTGSFAFGFLDGGVFVDGLPMPAATSLTRWIGLGLGVLFLATGFQSARQHVAGEPIRAAIWAGWGALVPLVVLASLWFAFGNVDVDLGYASVALVLTVLLAAGGEAIARREEPALFGGHAVTLALIGAATAAVLSLHLAFDTLWTTILVGAAAALPALATRYRGYAVLGWLSVGAAFVVIGRIALDPTIVGAFQLGTTPVFNALLPGYGIPALAFGFAAWQLARTTSGRPRLVMEAVGALFALLTVAMLVRHAMNGGVIDAGVPTLAEQSIYTLIALGAGAMLIALDMKSPSPVFRTGSIAAGIVSVALIVVQHFGLLNPLFTDESTGLITFFNLLFLAYLLPALAAAALALYARAKRPRWYSAMLGLLAAALAFVYATLSLRRLFQGEFIGIARGMTQVETYAYSALWLAMGVALLVLGVSLKSQPLRIASAGLIALAVVKVFLFDMAELEGVLRAFSFIGLGVVLIGIGLFYQRLLTRAAKAA
ncbi:MAG: DUF2339 domain-containing protein [Mesorhizobium sp.]|nr:DUF2339 domain-containing protein [Mesorhizobium sp.]